MNQQRSYHISNMVVILISNSSPDLSLSILIIKFGVTIITILHYNNYYDNNNSRNGGGHDYYATSSL